MDLRQKLPLFKGDIVTFKCNFYTLDSKRWSAFLRGKISMCTVGGDVFVHLYSVWAHVYMPVCFIRVYISTPYSSQEKAANQWESLVS